MRLVPALAGVALTLLLAGAAAATTQVAEPPGLFGVLAQLLIQASAAGVSWIVTLATRSNEPAFRANAAPSRPSVSASFRVTCTPAAWPSGSQ